MKNIDPKIGAIGGFIIGYEKRDGNARLIPQRESVGGVNSIEVTLGVNGFYAVSIL